jgi:putative restriction endonuclease
VADEDLDWLVRLHAFDRLAQLSDGWGDPLPWQPLAEGFEFRGRRVTLLGARGIWKPAAMSLPISITTSHRDPYGDLAGDDGLLRYRYFGDDISHSDNAGLRSCMDQGRPLIYFRGVEKGWYSPVWPMLLIGDDPLSLTFIGACDDVERLSPGAAPSAIDVARRQYVTRAALVRLHQAGFRRRVLTAYRESCTVCRLHHPELLDAAHILPDRHERGEPLVSNGLAMCKIHHAAFDANIMGIRPDHIVEVRADILTEVDGPMLRHGLQQLHGEKIVVPRQRGDVPDTDRLEARYEEFRAAS